ncbi:MAG: Ig-like domain-containing protein [Pseudonocardia sp.]
MSRRTVLALAALLVGALGVTFVATGLPESGPPAVFGTPAAVSYGAATDVAPLDPVSVSVSDGTFTDVALVAPDGTPVEGALDASRTRWTSSGPLAYATTYSWRGTATGTDGSTTPLTGTVATVTPKPEVRGTINIGDGRTVGVAAPIAIQFDAHVADRAAVERALSVETSVPVEGAWGWLPDEGGGSRVHWRPKEYWPAGTKVTVTAKLFGVPYGEGAWGSRDVSSSFSIGPAQIVKADVNSHRLLVVRNGRTVANFPASYGLDDDPNRNTRSGIHVVTEKFENRRMISEQFDYDVVMQWAVRMSNNGEFIHANPNTTSVQGSANVSHGCVNLSTADAKTYYDMARYGDPVEVTGSTVRLAERDGDIWDWTLSWEQWKSLSAL